MSPKAIDSAPAGKKALKKKQMKAGRWRWLWLTLSLTGVAAVSASAGALLAVAIAGTPLMQTSLNKADKAVFNQDEPISTGLNFRLPRLTRPVNILVLGTKVLTTDIANPPEELKNVGYNALVNSLEGLTDTMLLIRFSPQSHQVVVLSLPRDTRTYIDGVGLTKLNSANVYGGPALTARTTSDLLGGVQIDRYIRINVQGVEKLIDAMGGVKVYVPQDMKYQDDSQHLYINLKQGDQHLNGNQAMQFLRFRYDAYGDIGRVQRQQMLMRAFIEQALKPATLTRLPQVLSVIQSNLDTNLSVEELIALVGFAAQTDRPNVQMLMLPGYFGSEAEYGASYWLPNLPSIESLVSQYFSRDGVIDVSATVPNTLKLAVQDSTGETYTVQSLLNHLGNIGYSNIYVDQPWNESLAVTKIIAQQGDAQNAERIRQALGFGEVLVESTGSLDSDITIRLGQDAISALQPSSPPASPSPGIAPANQIPAIESSTPSSDPAVAPAVMESSSEAPVEPAPEIQVEPPAESSDTTDAIEPAAKATPPLELNPPVAASPDVVAPVAISPTPLHSKLPVVAASPAINPPVASPVAAPSIVLQKTEPASSTAQPTLSP